MTRLFLPILLLLTFACPATSETYSFSATVDRHSISVGDPLHLLLAVEVPAGSLPVVIPDFSLPESFRVLEAPEARRESAGEGRDTWTQAIKLTSFRTGETEIPTVRVKVVSSEGDTTVLSDHPISILVKSVKPDSLTDILSVKEPVSIDAVIPVWVWGLLVALALILIGLIYWRRGRKEVETVTETVVIDWFEEFRKLSKAGLIERGEFDAYYTRLSEVLRRFLEQRTGVEAMERATHEIRLDLTNVEMDEQHILDVEGFLNEADLVKFARFEPDAARSVQDGDRVLRLMTAINDVYRERERRAAVEAAAKGKA